MHYMVLFKTSYEIGDRPGGLSTFIVPAGTDGK